MPDTSIRGPGDNCTGEYEESGRFKERLGRGLDGDSGGGDDGDSGCAVEGSRRGLIGPRQHETEKMTAILPATGWCPSG